MAKFRLERVIEIKNKVMDDKRNDLERARAALYKTHQAVTRLEEEIGRNYLIMESPMGGSDFSVLKDFLFSLDAKKEHLLDEARKITAQIASITTELVELAKEVKMLDSLKAKAMEREKKMGNKKEQKALDDMALRILERNRDSQ
ncbi:MAG TPA: flagellar FliJ family protein [Syntrophorhabdaceae bacterium]|jgi:flagellar export protein FliJ